MIDPEINASPNDRQAGLYVQAVAVCLGTSAGLYLVGVAGLYRAVLDPLPRTMAIVVAVALLAMAIGSWVPQRLVSRRLRSAGRGPKDTATDVESDLLPHTITLAQQGFLWVVLAGVCLAAGITALLLLWASGPIERVHTWIIDRFFLSAAELLAADLVAVILGVALPWMILGLAFACLYALSAITSAPGRAGSGLVGTALIGAAVGAAIAASPVFQSSPGRTMLLAQLPLFLAAVLSVARAGKRRPIDVPEPTPELQLPQSAPEAGQALLATLVVWGFLVGSLLTVWPRVVATCLAISPAAAPYTGAWLVLSMGVGALLGDWLAIGRERPANRCGPWTVIAGLATGLAVIVCAATGQADQRHVAPDFDVPTVVILASLAATGLTAGVSLAYLKRTLIAQSGSAAAAWPPVITSGLAGVVLGVMISLCWTVPMAGTLVALSAAGLAVLAAGGMLVIFDVGGPTKRHKLRLIGVFAALAGLMIGLPKVRSSWMHWHADADVVREGSWLTAALIKVRDAVVIEPWSASDVSLEDRRRSTRAALRAVMRLRGPINRCLLVSTGELRIPKDDAAICREFDVAYYDTVATELFHRPDGPTRDRATADHEFHPALRSLRATRKRYDLVVLTGVPNDHSANAAIWSIETLERVARRLAPGGMLAGIAHPAEYDRTSLATIAATFAAAAPSEAHAGLVGTDASQVLVLMTAAATHRAWDWPSAAQVGMHHAGPVSTFSKVTSGVLPNSLRAASLPQRGRPDEGGLQLTKYVSETPDWRPLRPGDRPVPVWPPSPGLRKLPRTSHIDAGSPAPERGAPAETQ